MDNIEGLNVISVPHQRKIEYNGVVFPLVLTSEQDNSARVSLFEWISLHQSLFDELLLKHKAILFRGFDALKTHDDFHRFVIASGLKSMPYIGGAAVRTQLTERVFTANESPSTEKIPFHHELAQTPDPPTHILFFCEQPPLEGGETPLLISNEIYQCMKSAHPQTMAAIEALGVQYIRVMSKSDNSSSAIGRGWQSTFQCNSKGNMGAWLVNASSIYLLLSLLMYCWCLNSLI